MDLHLVENIIAIADERSITRAAEKRFVTQSALNQQLQKIEEEFDFDYGDEAEYDEDEDE